MESPDARLFRNSPKAGQDTSSLHNATSVSRAPPVRTLALPDLLGATDWLDGGMITLAMFSLNFFHPGYLLGRRHVWLTARREGTAFEKEKQQPGASGGDSEPVSPVKASA